jgi:hypothetical protein
VSHPRDSPDWAPSYFFFDYLTEKRRGRSFTASGDLIFVIKQVFSEISKIGLRNVFTNWITRLSCVMKNGGKSYIESSKTNRILFILSKL